MNRIQFNPDGGELGRAALRCIEPLELTVVLPHVAHILESLYLDGDYSLPYYYAFEFNVNSKHGIELVMMTAKLPEHVQWYECDGLKMFQIRGPSGGVVTSWIIYLVTKSR